MYTIQYNFKKLNNFHSKIINISLVPDKRNSKFKYHTMSLVYKPLKLI